MIDFYWLSAAAPVKVPEYFAFEGEPPIFLEGDIAPITAAAVVLKPEAVLEGEQAPPPGLPSPFAPPNLVSSLITAN